MHLFNQTSWQKFLFSYSSFYRFLFSHLLTRFASMKAYSPAHPRKLLAFASTKGSLSRLPLSAIYAGDLQSRQLPGMVLATQLNSPQPACRKPTASRVASLTVN